MEDHQKPKPGDERLLGILWQTWREAPRSTYASVVVILASAVFPIVEQLAEGFGDDPVRVATKMIVLLSGMGGALLLCVAYALHNVAQSLAKCNPWDLWGSIKAESQGFKPRVLHRVMLALPTLGMVAAVLLSINVAFLIMRALEGRRLGLIMAAFFVGLLLLAGQTVTRTTRFLYRHAHEQAEAAAVARAEATEAQLAALQAHMNPHFLFNALNTVASLVRTDPKAAESTVENLAGVLRRTLDRNRHTWRTVGDEVDYVKAYLAVEQERWGERLQAEWSIAPEVRPLPLPPMTLQPLVENALKHGLGTRLESGTLRIVGVKENGVLRLTVADDGVGFPPRHREGTGLGNLRRRLETLYGESAGLEIQSSASGASVVLELPAVRTV